MALFSRTPPALPAPLPPPPAPPVEYLPPHHRGAPAPTCDNDNALVIDLPLPPSVNRVIARLGNSSSVVQRWIKQADRHVLMDNRRIRAGAIDGLFAADITWTLHVAGLWDIDNRVKITLDFLQRIEVIRNDCDCRLLTVRFGEAPLGCRVRLMRWAA